MSVAVDCHSLYGIDGTPKAPSEVDVICYVQRISAVIDLFIRDFIFEKSKFFGRCDGNNLV